MKGIITKFCFLSLGLLPLASQASIIGLLHASHQSPVEISALLVEGKATFKIYQKRGYECPITLYRYNPSDLEKGGLSPDEKDMGINLWVERKCLEESDFSPKIQENKTTTFSVEEMFSLPGLNRFREQFVKDNFALHFCLQELGRPESSQVCSDGVKFSEITKSEKFLYKTFMDQFNPPIRLALRPTAEELRQLKDADPETEIMNLPVVPEQERVRPSKSGSFLEVTQPLVLVKGQADYAIPSEGRYDFYLYEGKVISNKEEINKLLDPEGSVKSYCVLIVNDSSQNSTITIAPQILRRLPGASGDSTSGTHWEKTRYMFFPEAPSNQASISTLQCTIRDPIEAMTVEEVQKILGNKVTFKVTSF